MIPQEYAAWANASFPWEDMTCTCQQCRRTLHSPRVERAAQAAGTFLALVRQASKSAEMVRARQAFWFQLTIVEGMSYPQAARRTGHDHTSVLYGVRQYAAREFGIHPRSKREDILAAWRASVAKQATEQAA